MFSSTMVLFLNLSQHEDKPRSLFLKIFLNSKWCHCFSILNSEWTFRSSSSNLHWVYFWPSNLPNITSKAIRYITLSTTSEKPEQFVFSVFPSLRSQVLSSTQVLTFLRSLRTTRVKINFHSLLKQQIDHKWLWLDSKRQALNETNFFLVFRAFLLEKCWK